MSGLRNVLLSLVVVSTPERLPAADEWKPTTTLEHTTDVRAVAVSPDGKVLASATDGGLMQVVGKGNRSELKLWDLTNRKAPVVLRGHTQGCPALAFSSDGKVLASGSWDGSVRLWDVNTGKGLGAAFRGHNGHVYTVALSPDGALLASAGSDRIVRLWDVPTRKEKFRLGMHTGNIHCVVFSPDGSMVASAGVDKNLRLWNGETGRYEVLERRGRVAAPATNEVRLWDAKTGRAVGGWGHMGPVNSIVFTADGKSLMASGDRVVRIWDLATRKEKPGLKGHSGPITSLAISPDGKVLASVSSPSPDSFPMLPGLMDSKSEVRLWDPATGAEKAAFSYPGELLKMAFSSDGKTLAGASGLGQTVALWDLSKVRDRKPDK